MTVLYDKDYTELSSGLAEFGVRDKQGRAVGYKWRIFSVTYTEVPEGQRSGYRLDGALPLKHLEVDAYPTRDGKHYGASGRNIPCITQAEAEAIIAKRIEQARKRETKRFSALPLLSKLLPQVG